jgi:hypothetical protein
LLAVVVAVEDPLALTVATGHRTQLRTAEMESQLLQVVRAKVALMEFQLAAKQALAMAVVVAVDTEMEAQDLVTCQAVTQSLIHKAVVGALQCLERIMVVVVLVVHTVFLPQLLAMGCLLAQAILELGPMV